MRNEEWQKSLRDLDYKSVKSAEWRVKFRKSLRDLIIDYSVFNERDCLDLIRPVFLFSAFFRNAMRRLLRIE